MPELKNQGTVLFFRQTVLLKNRTVPLILFAFFLLGLSCYAEQPQAVRVLIMQEVESLWIKVPGYYEVIDLADGSNLSSGENLNTTVTVSKTGILIKGRNSKVSKLLIRPKSNAMVMIDGRHFRGDIELARGLQDRLAVINSIGLEDYIKGISIREISHYWPTQALKAQVIAFRSFALYKMEENKAKDYDVTSDIYSQVYSGKAAERYRINNAVDQTKGIILTYQGKVLPAFYHATCAGNTEDASLLWNIDLAPLKGVTCGFCKESPHYSWHYDLSLQEAQDTLAKEGFKLKGIEGIEILGKDKSGRIADLKIISAKKDLKISAKDFRNTLGPNVVKSANFSVKIIDNDMVFEGLGWGHGVGLCQWGAYFMAKQGYNYEQILKYYYPGCEITSSKP